MGRITVINALKRLAFDVQKLPWEAKAQQEYEIHRLGNRFVALLWDERWFQDAIYKPLMGGHGR